jgi:malate dehydrogenase (oxaloacetate-decarboxylating)(NADP+)
MPHDTRTLKERALAYHGGDKPGKIEVISTKPLVTQEDLSLGYTPGVAEVCREIAANPTSAADYTAKSNLVAVITNGTAVLGLGNIGPLASKPVMEGKGVLFKKFANIDVFDLELDAADPDKFIEAVTALAPTFGGINLEDIKAPECFYIEEQLHKKLDIPVLHDDQHGTAIIVAAAFINALKVTGKRKNNVKIVTVGAGAAGLACMNLLVDYGVPAKNITLVDRSGVIYEGRDNVNDRQAPFAHKTNNRTLADALDGADVFFGLSAGGLLKPEMVATMAKKPIIFAMANPDPEILPDDAKAVRPDAIIGTGRSDFPNQINNVLGFPYLFRGALDCGAKTFNTDMKLAAAQALADLAREAPDPGLHTVYKVKQLKFGPEYLIPKPFDSRLLPRIAGAVAKAAMETGVATRPIADLEAYAHSLEESLDRSFTITRRIMNSARKDPRKVVFVEGEDERTLRAAQQVISEGLAHPILLGRGDITLPLINELGLEMQAGQDFTFIDPQKDERLAPFAEQLYTLRQRDGLLKSEAEVQLRSRWASFAAMLLRNDEADAMVAGLSGRFDRYLRILRQILPLREGVSNVYALQLLLHRDRTLFVADTHVNHNPSAEMIAEMARLAWEEVGHFGVEPRLALLSHSNFGASNEASATKMREAYERVRQEWPEIMIEGEVQADFALDHESLKSQYPHTGFEQPANVLLMPNIDAANIAFNLLRSTNTTSEYIGPILLGMDKPVHILHPTATVRRIVNMTALAVVEAQYKGK